MMGKPEEKSLTELATEYYHTKDPLVRGRLVELAQENVRMASAKMFKRIRGRVEFDELKSYANEGLLNAINNYDPGKGRQFETYLFICLDGSILTGLRNDYIFTLRDRERLKIMIDFEIRFLENENKLPERDDYQKHWIEKGLPPNKFDSFYVSVLGWVPTRSLDEKVGRRDGKESERGDLIEDLRDNPLNRISSRELFEVFEKDLKTIPEKHRGGLRALILEDLTLEEAGKILGGVTRERARQLKEKYTTSR